MGTGSSQYTASYDTSGNMVCRAPDGSTTCAGGTTTGQQLSWDNEGRLVAWQNAPSSPTSTAQYLYDGEGNRVEQQATTSGTTTTTTYVGSLESVATTGGTSTATTYYYAAGQRIALAVNGTLSYLASDLLGSATVALNDSGTPTASQLYAPYGGVRYSNDTMPTDYGFTGQRVDSTTGLDYYGARYYAPTLGQFTSADTVMDGLNRYGYVGGNPISHTDPRGHRDEEMPDGYGDGGAASGNGGIGEGGESGEGNSGGGGPGTVGDGLTTGPAGDMSPDLVVIQTPEGFEYVDPAITDADLQAETQDIQQTTQQLHNENDDQSQEPQNPSKLSNPSNPSNHPENPDNPNTPQTPNQPGNPGTTVSSTPSGTIVTTGTQAGSGPFFQSTLSSDGSNFTMQYAYRNGLPDHASDVFAKQFDLAGGNPAQLQQLTLENIEESQTIAQWMEWGSLAGSTLDKMSNYFANSIGVQLGAPSWSGPNIIYPILP